MNWGSGPAGEVTLHDLTQDGQRAVAIWDHLPGSSLVPVEFLDVEAALTTVTAQI